MSRVVDIRCERLLLEQDLSPKKRLIVCSLYLYRRGTMLRLPIWGFARRVDDTVARAMAILNTREDYTARAQVPRLPVSTPKPRKLRSWS